MRFNTLVFGAALLILGGCGGGAENVAGGPGVVGPDQDAGSTEDGSSSVGSDAAAGNKDVQVPPGSDSGTADAPSEAASLSDDGAVPDGASEIEAGEDAGVDGDQPDADSTDSASTGDDGGTGADSSSQPDSATEDSGSSEDAGSPDSGGSTDSGTDAEAVDAGHKDSGTDACVPRTTCSAGANCGTEPNGCGGSIACGTCSNQTCLSNVCTGVCSPGETQPCGDCGRESCTASGTWSTTCSGQGVCAPGTKESCNTYGTQTCGVSCGWALCSCPKVPVCTPGTKQCGSSGGVETCDSCGQWGAEAICAENQGCYEGACNNCVRETTGPLGSYVPCPSGQPTGLLYTCSSGIPDPSQQACASEVSPSGTYCCSPTAPVPAACSENIVRTMCGPGYFEFVCPSGFPSGWSCNNPFSDIYCCQ